jgi:hypothetical protein
MIKSVRLPSVLAVSQDPVKDKLNRFGLFTQLGESCFFPTIGAPVSSFLENYDVEWKNWEDESQRFTG